jgi:basic membrane protein A
MSKSGVIGYIGSVPIPEVIMGINATLLGMQSVNPQARLKFVFINSWYDPGKEGDAAKALLDQGCDIMTQHTDSPAPLQVCEQRGLKAFGEATDMIRFAEKTQLTAPINNWGPYYIKRAQDLIDGKWKSEDVWGGLASDMLHMAPYRNMPDDVMKLAQSTEADIKSGKLKPFGGKLKDQSGGEKSVADDGAIASMNWLVQGVDGKLPS